jgi:hypothetical protein
MTLTLISRPNELVCTELTGFRVPAGEGIKLFPGADTFARNSILMRGKFSKSGKAI